MVTENESPIVLKAEFANGEATSFDKYWDIIVKDYGLPFGQCCIIVLQYIISVCYAIYARFTLFNVVMFLIKCVPTGIYMHKFIKGIYTTSRERLKQQRSEFEDLQLQVQIITTKLSVRDAEFAERVEQLRRSVERLRKVRARVRRIIASDDELRRTVDCGAWDDDSDIHVHCTLEDECEFIVELLKELKCDQSAASEPASARPGGRGVGPGGPPGAAVPGGAADAGDCRVKIVRVTNVYKVAYLKHYIKQKRLRRANKQAMLKKKMDSIKKMLDDWQKTLNMAINSKLSLLNMNSAFIDVAPQHAMGDSKSIYRDYSDSDSDFRNSLENGPDDYSTSTAQNLYMQHIYDYETAVSKEMYDHHNSMTSDRYVPLRSECSALVAVAEETSSQMAVEELASDASGDGDCRDIIAL